jgi:NAD(P)-dependent dehydrogenase (short-subunit alcohol dehydrogenase family)
VDVTSRAQIHAAVERVESLDILINNAGFGVFDDFSDSAVLEQHLAVNVLGTHRVTQALRYFPARLSTLGSRVEGALREVLAEAPSFVAFEGYDTVAVIAELLRLHGTDRARIAEGWSTVAVDGTRGQNRFGRAPGVSVWQWIWPPIQVVARDPKEPDRFSVLYAAGAPAHVESRGSRI